MQDVQILVMPQGFIAQCPDLNRSKSVSPALYVGWKCASCFILSRTPVWDWSSHIQAISTDLIRLNPLWIQLDQCAICNCSLSNMQWLPWTCTENHGAAGYFIKDISQGKNDSEIHREYSTIMWLSIAPFITIDFHLWDILHTIYWDWIGSFAQGKRL